MSIYLGPTILVFSPFILLFKLLNSIIHCICPNGNRFLPCPCQEGDCIDNMWFCSVYENIKCFPKSCCILGKNCQCCGKPSCCCQTPYFRCTSEECCCCCPPPTEESIERANARMKNQNMSSSAEEIPNNEKNEEIEYQQSQYYPNYITNNVEAEIEEDNNVLN